MKYFISIDTYYRHIYISKYKYFTRPYGNIIKWRADDNLATTILKNHLMIGFRVFRYE